MATVAAPLPRLRTAAPAALAVGGWAGLVIAGYLLGAALQARDPLVHIGAPPLVGRYDLLLDGWLVPAVAAAVAVAVGAHRAAARLPWRALLPAAWGAGAAWTALLALAAGPGALSAPLRTRYEYLAAVGDVGGIHDFLTHFTQRLADYPTHVKGHPPGMVLLLAGLDRIGLGGADIAAALVIGVGALAAPAAAVVVRAATDEATARRALPFVAFAPSAVWVATSADGLFMGVAACGIACVAARRAVLGGVLLGGALILTYGAAPLGAVVVAAAVACHGRRDAMVILATTGAAAATVLAAFAAAGFWWPDGLRATHELYAAGVASRRPYLDFLVIAPAALALAVGPATAAGLACARGRLTVLAASGAVAICAADLSGLSRGENERIWLLFTPWLLIGAAALPRPRAWLGAQVALAIALQVGVRSPW